MTELEKLMKMYQQLSEAEIKKVLKFVEKLKSSHNLEFYESPHQKE